MLTVAHDPLCDEGLAYVRRLSDARVRVTHIHCNDHMHGVLSQGRLVPAGDVMANVIGLNLSYALHFNSPTVFSTPTAGMAGQPQETT